MTTTGLRPADSAIRSFVRRSGDRALTSLLALPPTTARYTVRRRVPVPMRDGVDLLADHYAPVSAEPAGTLLVRGPYGRGFPFSALFARLYAARGYHVILQSVRGTFGSAGDFQPMVNEVADGADTVAWLRQQPWFTGYFGTVGLSYLGFTQWALLTDPPPELAAAVITVGPHDFFESSWGTGSFSLNDFLGWSDLVAHQEHGSRLRGLIRSVGARRRLSRAVDGLPLGQAGRALLGTAAPWYESWLEHPDRDDPFWVPHRVGAALEAVNVPVLLIGGWQDPFLNQTLAQYARLRERGVEVALTVGPWTHTEAITKGARGVTRESLDWLGAHVAGAGASAMTRPGRSAARRSPVRIFLTGHGWIDLPDWPPPVAQRVLYLQPSRLAEALPAATVTPSTFDYDPADPTPTIGGRLLGGGGYRDDSALARRDDVLSFIGDVLTEDLFVLGNPVVELSHTSDNPHVDVFVRVGEVDAKGRSRNVSDGYRRLPDGSGGVIRIELDAVAHRFPAGSRIRLLITGACHPRFARNTGSGEPPVTARRLQPATHTVHHGAGGTSRLLLPARLDAPPGGGTGSAGTDPPLSGTDPPADPAGDLA